MKAKKIILTALVAFLPAVFVSAQTPSEPIKIGGRTVEKDGSIVCATDISLLTQPVINEINMGMRSVERNGSIQYYVVIAVPYKEINIGSDGALALSMKNGETISLPVQRQMKWNQDRLLVGTGEKTAYVMRIPFEITESQKDQLISGDVTNVRMTGTDRAIDFKTKRFSNILKRQYGELLAFQGRSSASSTSKSTNPGATATATASANNSIHETAATKTLTVYDYFHMGKYSNGYAIIRESNSGNTYIANIEGEITGNIQLESPYQASEPMFDKYGHAVVRLPNHQDVIIEPNGNIIYEFEQSAVVTQFIDGVAKCSINGFGIINPTIKYINVKGENVYPKYDRPGSLITGGYERVFPIVDGRRLDMIKSKDVMHSGYDFGYMDENGTPVIDHKYTYANTFYDGLASVAILDQNKVIWGFIDISGNYVIQPKFSNEPGDFHNGYSVVKKTNGMYCYIDMTGNAVSEEYRGASSFINGYARVFTAAGEYYLIDRNFNRVKKVDLFFYNGRNNYSINAVEGDRLYTPSGEKLLDSSDLEFSADGLSVVDLSDRKGNVRSGYINTAGEVILKVVRSEF